MSATDESGRRLYKARGPDGEVAWVDHDELWRLQHEQAEELRLRRSRRRRVAAVAAAALLALAVGLIAYRLWPTAGAPAGAPAPGKSSPAPSAAAGDPAAAPRGASVPDPAAPTGRPDPATARSSPEQGGGRPLSPEAAAERPPPTPEERIAGFVRSWSAAWARRDVPAYLASYAAGFRPADGLSRRDWERLRRRRLLDPPAIRIEIEELEIAIGAAGRAEARFVQRYDSPDYSDVVRKVLLLVEEEGRWRIAAERADPA